MARLRTAVKLLAGVQAGLSLARAAWRALPAAVGLARLSDAGVDLGIGAAGLLLAALVVLALGLGRQAGRDRLWAVQAYSFLSFMLATQVPGTTGKGGGGWCVGGAVSRRGEHRGWAWGRLPDEGPPLGCSQLGA